MRASNRLTVLKVSSLKQSGRFPDGGGLYLQISPSGTKSWLFRFMLNSRSREMGLGPAGLVSLAEARAMAVEARKLTLRKVDPIEARRARLLQEQLGAAQGMTFREASRQFIKAHAPGWKNPKHVAQWYMTLLGETPDGKKTENDYCAILHDLPVSDIDTAQMLRVISPIWTTKTETASRLRGRVEAVLDWAKVQGHRDGDNPARWKGHLKSLLPSPRKVSPVRHHPALPYAELPIFMKKLRAVEGTTARALEFTILTCARTSETLGAKVIEIDWRQRAWIVPAERIKAAREHRVPLSDRSLELASEAKGGLLFAYREGEELSENTMLSLLDRLGYGHVTVHGFRSTFRDWAAEFTNYPNEMAEMAIAHVVSDETEAAYRRGDLFEKRRRMMRDWEAFCGGEWKTGHVVPIGKAAQRY